MRSSLIEGTSMLIFSTYILLFADVTSALIQDPSKSSTMSTQVELVLAPPLLVLAVLVAGLGVYYLLVYLRLPPLPSNGVVKDVESGESKASWTWTSLFTPIRIQKALSMVVVAKFLWVWFVYDRQSRLYAETESLPNNSISHYVTQAQWSLYRPMNVAIDPFQQTVILPYMEKLAAIWFIAPLVLLRSKIWRSLRRCCVKQDSIVPVEGGEMEIHGSEKESAGKSALRYAGWFLAVSVVYYIRNDIINKLLLQTYCEPIAKYDKRTVAPIMDFATAAGYDANSVYVQAGWNNAETYGLIFTPAMVLGGHLGVKDTIPIMAHELGHWKHRHALLQFVQDQLELMIVFIAAYLLRNFSPLYAAFGYVRGRTSPWVLTRCVIVGVFALTPLWALYTPFANISHWGIEYVADAYAQELGYGKQLCDALVHMQMGKVLIMDPLFAATVTDHPPLEQRLEMLGC